MPSSALTRSTFGTLLKQSKFSSFDPRISQVYTTHGGDAHRGQWGFKRPLPLRRRGAYITVKTVDTPEYQTEWNSAEPQGLWMKNWDELKITPQEPWFGEDGAGENLVNSNYLPQTQSDSRRPYVRDLEGMTRKEFSNHLDKIRACRDAFVRQRAAREQLGEVTSYELSNLSKPSTPWHDLIATQFSQQRRSNRRSREVEDLPHSCGGLSYAQYSPLQTFLMTRERKGRLADVDRGRDKNITGYVASFAGMAGRVLKGQAGMAKPVVWDDARQTGEAMMRPQKVVVNSSPVVVGRRQGLKAAKVEMELRVWEEQSHSRSNPHRPGSAAYIAAAPPLRSVQELTTHAVARKARGGKKRPSAVALLRSAMPAP